VIYFTVYHKRVMTTGRNSGSALGAVWLALGLMGVANAFQPLPESSMVLWYKHPAARWEDALPVGNGRLGAMVFGATGEEQIQLNEDTYWSGGPYSTVVKGGREALPES
jgi:hypothetical protein